MKKKPHNKIFLFLKILLPCSIQLTIHTYILRFHILFIVTFIANEQCARICCFKKSRRDGHLMYAHIIPLNSYTRVHNKHTKPLKKTWKWKSDKSFQMERVWRRRRRRWDHFSFGHTMGAMFAFYIRARASSHPPTICLSTTPANTTIDALEVIFFYIPHVKNTKLRAPGARLSNALNRRTSIGNPKHVQSI